MKKYFYNLILRRFSIWGLIGLLALLGGGPAVSFGAWIELGFNDSISVYNLKKERKGRGSRPTQGDKWSLQEVGQLHQKPPINPAAIEQENEKTEAQAGADDSGSSKGSSGLIFEIPDEFIVRNSEEEGSPLNLEKSLQNWRSHGLISQSHGSSLKNISPNHPKPIVREFVKQPEYNHVTGISSHTKGNQVLYPVQIRQKGTGSSLPSWEEGSSSHKTYYIDFDQVMKNGSYQEVRHDEVPESPRPIRPQHDDDVRGQTDKQRVIVKDKDRGQDRRTEGQVCLSCSRYKRPTFGGSVAALEQQLGQIQNHQAEANKRELFPPQTSKAYQPKGLNPLCSKFIDAQGKLGEWGLMMKKEMNKVGRLDKKGNRTNEPLYPNLSASNSEIAAYCQNYNSFDVEEKQTFLIHIMTVLANEESSCDEGAKQVGKRGGNPGHGLFQMDSRGKEIMARNKAAEIETGQVRLCSNPLVAQNNIACSVYILDKQLKKRGLFDSSGYVYWGPLIRKYDSLTSAARTYPGCG